MDARLRDKPVVVPVHGLLRFPEFHFHVPLQSLVRLPLGLHLVLEAHARLWFVFVDELVF